MKKKVILLFLYFSLFLFTVGASPTIAVINSKIDFIDYVPFLKYDNQVVENDFDIVSQYSLSDNSTQVYTNKFEIVTNEGNQNTDLNFQTLISTGSFKTTVDDQLFDSKIFPTVVKIENSPGIYSTENNNTEIDTLIPFGAHDSMVLAQFKFSWKGKNTLPAGVYTSTITISYSID